MPKLFIQTLQISEFHTHAQIPLTKFLPAQPPLVSQHHTIHGSSWDLLSFTSTAAHAQKGTEAAPEFPYQGFRRSGLLDRAVRDDLEASLALPKRLTAWKIRELMPPTSSRTPDTWSVTTSNLRCPMKPGLCLFLRTYHLTTPPLTLLEPY